LSLTNAVVVKGTYNSLKQRQLQKFLCYISIEACPGCKKAAVFPPWI